VAALSDKKQSNVRVNFPYRYDHGGTTARTGEPHRHNILRRNEALFLESHLTRSLVDGRLVHQPLSFGCFHCQNRALSIVQLAIVPQKIELPQVTM
jgi:hypothetical protein